MRLCYSLVMFMSLIMLGSGISLLAACGQKGPLYLPSEVQQQADKDKKSPGKTQQQP